ncbi:MAG: hypothetical protein KGM42_13170 [Hyphomicrobiales bacterium]|nr:hypothetical protein [Hyphomicrobiales bacterium]
MRSVNRTFETADCGNPMSPTHANKKGVHYRYYTSQALLQRRPSDAGTIARVSAEDVERLVCSVLRARSRIAATASDRDVIEHLERRGA